MRVGIVGRHEALLQAALAMVRAFGHAGTGTLEDRVALGWIDARVVDALVIGGGVEGASRQVLLQACRQGGVAAIEVAGPHQLEAALRAL